MSGLAPTPDQMNKMREVRTQKPTKEEVAEKGESQTITVKSDSPPMHSEIGHIIWGIHWQYQKRILDMFKILVDSDKWETVRTIVMDIQTEQVETMRSLVKRKLFEAVDHDSEEKDSEENLNGNGLLNGTE